MNNKNDHKRAKSFIIKLEKLSTYRCLLTNQKCDYFEQTERTIRIQLTAIQKHCQCFSQDI